ncbi:septation ring formation regulator EzrA [Streptococcus caprae]|uniref:Septation ring formation regulator EzrA n=1 Tax=Streptococcus caprae TaxID=1640501 RepID=A0ABV8CWF7_9STRE
MPTGIILTIVAVVIIVIIIYLIGVLIRRRNETLLEKLEERKQAIFDLPINQEVEAVKDLHLVGQSQVSFREWNQKWVDLSTNSFSDLENHIFEAENLNDSFNFIKAKHEIDSIESQLKLVEEDTQAIKEALSVLKAQEEKNSARVKYALDLYEVLDGTITENRSNYGPASAELDKQLKNIQAEFSQFVALNSSGDPVEAAEVLEKAEEHTIALGQISEQVPALVEKLNVKFPDQLEDLESGYRKLLEEHYFFPEDNIEPQFQKIREGITDASEVLAQLHLDKAASKCEDIQGDVDKLYDVFEKEIGAHKHVVKLASVLPDYFKHVSANNQLLTDELARLNQSFILNESTSLSLNSFKTELEKLEETTLPSAIDFVTEEKPYSDLQKTLEFGQTSLKRIEDGQMEVFNNLKGVEQSEANSRQLLDQYINKLHTIKRYIEKRNLPGIPQDFLQVFFSTSAQLENLKDELSRGRIDIEMVERLTTAAEGGVEVLEETTYQVIQDAVLTEQLLQYSNRYRSFDANVQAAFEQSLHYFEDNLDYRSSFEEISYALEIIEPGVTDRFVNAYIKTREEIRF